MINMRYCYLLFCLLLVVLSCKEKKTDSPGEELIGKAIEVAGGDLHENARIKFLFRGRLYESQRNEGNYSLTRQFEDSLGLVRDELSNQGFKRFRNGKAIALPDSLASAYSESVNSVHYFVQLPYGLQGKAVIKELIGQDSIEGKPYYEIRVSFMKEGGGKDHEDIYMYWVNQDSLTVDFLAYRFYVNNGGIRFRKAVNPRYINGIRFVDYENYRPRDLGTPLVELDELYEKDSLIKVSQIENRILEVEIQEE